jgi:hypothetical protein
MILFLLPALLSIVLSFPSLKFSRRATDSHKCSNLDRNRYRNWHRLHLTAHILAVGKANGAEQFIGNGISQYVRRLSNVISIRFVFFKSDQDLLQGLRSKSNNKGVVVALDENGTEYTSREFSDFLFNSLEEVC